MFWFKGSWEGLFELFLPILGGKKAFTRFDMLLAVMIRYLNYLKISHEGIILGRLHSSLERLCYSETGRGMDFQMVMRSSIRERLPAYLTISQLTLILGEEGVTLSQE